MQNIPTELLRAFISVIDYGGFTRAGEHLGRSQPAISLQIKRLQDQIGVSLFDRGNGGSAVTEYGRLVEAYARRILALNDELVGKITERNHRGRIRIGLPQEFADTLLPDLLTNVLARDAKLGFDINCEFAPRLLEGLKEGSYDLIFAITREDLREMATSVWSEPLSWFGRKDIIGDRSQPLRLISYTSCCPYREAMIEALTRDGRPHEVIYTSQSLISIKAAVRAGFGVTALPTRSPVLEAYALDQEAELPPLADVQGVIMLAGALSGPEAGPLAAHFAEILSQRRSEVA